MNELDFRRQALADPHCKDPDFLAVAGADPEKQALLDELQQFDRQIETALKVDVPNELADRILLGQSFAEQKRRRNRTRWQLALAASLAFSAGATLTLLNNPFVPSLGEITLAHMYEDLPLMERVDMALDLDQVNTKLAAYGGELKQSLGHVYSVNYCVLDGIRGIHLVMAGSQGRVSLFILPPSPSRPGKETFADKRFNGMLERTPHGELMLVGEKGESLEQLSKQVKENLRWHSI